MRAKLRSSLLHAPRVESTLPAFGALEERPMRPRDHSATVIVLLRCGRCAVALQVLRCCAAGDSPLHTSHKEAGQGHGTRAIRLAAMPWKTGLVDDVIPCAKARPQGPADKITPGREGRLLPCAARTCHPRRDPRHTIPTAREPTLCPRQRAGCRIEAAWSSWPGGGRPTRPAPRGPHRWSRPMRGDCRAGRRGSPRAGGTAKPCCGCRAAPRSR
jgi:hypothetical protein